MHIYSKTKIFFIYLFFIFFISCISFFAANLLFLFYDSHSSLILIPREKQNKKHAVVLDRNGQTLFHLYGPPHEIAYFNTIPLHTIQAFLAAEDHLFFTHQGISYRGILRSLLVNILKGSFSQGASTITQQMIKLSNGRRGKNIIKKIHEQISALAIEKHYSKQQILECYLNITYFGSGIYGIRSAARAFWNCNVEDLSIDQSATLAAIVQLPEYYCPLIHAENCLNRRNNILQKMSRYNFISQEEAETECKKPIVTHKNYFLHEYEHVRRIIQDFFESYIKIENQDNHFIHTTLDKNIQTDIAKTCGKRMMELHKKYDSIECGGVILDSHTAEIVAIFSGCNPLISSFNRALNAKRQVASLIKPLIVYHALSQGDTPYSVYIDEPLSLINDSWKPLNSNKLFDGPLTIAQALIKSKNIIPIKLLEKHGIEKFTDLITLTHLAPRPFPYLSLALGCVESSPLAVASYFRLFADDGIYKEPFLIKKIINDQGKTIYQNSALKHPCLNQIAAQQVRSILESSAQSLRKTLSLNDTFPLIAKTGTTNEKRTCWCAAATTKYTAVVYLGHDNNSKITHNGISSTRTATPLCFDLLRNLTPHNQFIYDHQLQKNISIKKRDSQKRVPQAKR